MDNNFSKFTLLVRKEEEGEEEKIKNKNKSTLMFGMRSTAEHSSSLMPEAETTGLGIVRFVNRKCHTYTLDLCKFINSV